jgi:hypothetical protein
LLLRELSSTIPPLLGEELTHGATATTLSGDSPLCARVFLFRVHSQTPNKTASTKTPATDTVDATIVVVLPLLPCPVEGEGGVLKDGVGVAAALEVALNVVATV